MSQLTDALARWAHGNGAWIADNGDMYSSTTFKKDVAAIEQLLAELNVQQGDQVFVALPNNYAFVAVYVGLLRYGAIAVPGNPSMPNVELERFLSRFDAKACVISPTSSDDWQEVIHHRFSASSTIVSFDKMPLVYVRTSENCQQDCQHTQGVVDSPWKKDNQVKKSPSDDDSAVLMFTSGTTGHPKGVMLCHRHLMEGVKNVKTSHRLTEHDVAYCMLPLFHINAQVIVVLSTLCSGGRLVMVDRFHASTFWRDMETYQVTWVSCVPTILSILAKGDVSASQTTSLRFVRSASAPLSPAILSRFESATGIPVVESYGMTEAAGQICINPLPPGIRKPGSVGLPVGVDLQIVMNETRLANAYEIGEIAIRGGNVIEHYVHRQVVDKGGKNPFSSFIFTGDLGYRDEDGYVYITGRSKEMINRAGEKLSPREIEDVLNAHSSVQKSAVIGVPDTLYGERVVAYVVPIEEDLLSIADLTEQLNHLCMSSLVKHKRPSEIRFVESLPVGATGKVQKHLLKEVVNRAQLA